MIPKSPTQPSTSAVRAPDINTGSPISPDGSIKPVDNLRVYTQEEIGNMTLEQLVVAIEGIKEAQKAVNDERLRINGLAKSIAPLGDINIPNKGNTDPNIPTPESYPSIAEQYVQQLDTLKAIGLLDSTGSYKHIYTGTNHGIMTINNIITRAVRYTIPTLAEIEQRLESKKSLLEEKSQQGFTRLLIVPNGLSIFTYIEKLKEATIKAAKVRQVQVPDLDSDGKPKIDRQGNTITKTIDQHYIPDTQGQEVIFNISNLIYMYHAHTNRGVWTAHGVPEDKYTKDTNGFTVHMIEEDLDLPRANANITIGNRKRIEANQTPQYYIDLLKAGTPPYQGESGMTAQDMLTLYIQTLHTQGVVMDNHTNGKSSTSLATGSYCIDDYVSASYYAADSNNWHLNGQLVGRSFSAASVRVSVRV